MEKKWIRYAVMLILAVVAFIGGFLVKERQIKELNARIEEKDKKLE